MDPILLHAADREAGVLCPHCGIEVVRGDGVAQCRVCGTVHHHACWQLHGCGAYACAPARRDLNPAAPLAAPVWRISADDLSAAKPIRGIPSMMAAVGGGPFPLAQPQYTGPRTSRLAIAALICAIAGIPFFGLITGVAAVVLAALALGEIQQKHKRRTGKGLAIAGLVLGVADAAAWGIFLVYLFNHGFFLGGGGRHNAPSAADFRVDPRQLETLPTPIARAMRANVLLTGHHGLGTELGSGIILRIAGGQAQILTNRHVIDPDFDAGSPTPDPASLKPVEVTLIDQSRSEGRIVWVAPGGVDLAVVTAPCLSAEARATAWPATQPSRVGDPVFAIGNPQAWGWTHTQGSISQFRSLGAGGRDINVIQSSTPINPGNSGGGLYDRDGNLIGVNTWTNDKRVSEGLSFSIDLSAFLDLAPAEYKKLTPPPPTPPTTEKSQP